MRGSTIIRLASAGAAACVGVLGFTASVAGGAPGQTGPATGQVVYPAPDPLGVLPPLGSPGTTVTGPCPTSWLFPDVETGTGNAVGLAFQGGNSVSYRNGNGGNVEGIADLVTFPESLASPTIPPPTTGLTDTGYVGQAHVWFGSNTNPNNTGDPNGNQQSYFGETFTFHGTAPDGSTIDLHGNPGSVTSASGHQSFWGGLKVTCTGATA